MSRKIVQRLCADILMFLLVAWAPWWLIVIAAAALLFVYNPYYEIILWGLCLDELYGASSALPYSLTATLIACLLLVGMYFLKTRLTFYK